MDDLSDVTDLDIAQWMGLIYRVLRRFRSHQDYDDLLQCAMIRLARALASYDAGYGVPLQRYLAQEIVFEAKEWVRADCRKRRYVPLLDTVEGRSGLEGIDGRIAIQDALRQVTPLRRRAILQSALGIAPLELSRLTGIAVATLDRRLLQARRQLRPMLAELLAVGERV